MPLAPRKPIKTCLSRMGKTPNLRMFKSSRERFMKSTLKSAPSDRFASPMLPHGSFFVNLAPGKQLEISGALISS